MVEGVQPDADPERHDPPRHRPRHGAHRSDGQRQEPRDEEQRREGQQAGLQRVVEHRHLRDQPADPVGREHRHLEADVRPERGATDHRVRRTELVEQGHHLLGEGRDGVDQRVVGPVGAAMAEQVQRDDVEPRRREVTRQRLLHPPRHQLAVQQNHPRLAAAVLGVFESVTRGFGVEEELADPFGDEHGAQSIRGRGVPRTGAPIRARCGAV